jgi:Family of unknown function (DUF5330)
MFFVRAAFWIFLILLLMPTSDKEKSDFYTAAGRTISDFGEFCTRNPDVCDKTGSIVTMIFRKIQDTVHSIDEAISRSGEGMDRDDGRHPGYTTRERNPDPRQRGANDDARMAPAVDRSQNTLRKEDLAPAWRGPAGGV